MIRPRRALRLAVMNRKTVWTLGLAALITLMVAACGGSSSSTSGGGGSGGSDNGIASKSADEIVNTAAQAAESASSVHVSGSIQAAGTSVGINLQIVSGKGATGTVSEGNASFNLVALGDNFYIQPDKAFLEKFAHSSAAVSLLEGKWLRGSRTGGSFASFGQLTSINSLMTSLVKGHGTLTKGSTTTVDGQDVIAIHDTSKGGTLYVATTGKPYPIQVSKTSGSKAGKVTFSQYNASFPIAAPKNSLNIDQLAQSAG